MTLVQCMQWRASVLFVPFVLVSGLIDLLVTLQYNVVSPKRLLDVGSSLLSSASAGTGDDSVICHNQLEANNHVNHIAIPYACDCCMNITYHAQRLDQQC